MRQHESIDSNGDARYAGHGGRAAPLWAPDWLPGRSFPAAGRSGRAGSDLVLASTLGRARTLELERGGDLPHRNTAGPGWDHRCVLLLAGAGPVGTDDLD